MEGDEHDWLELDVNSGELKTKAALDRETVEPDLSHNHRL